MTVSSLWRDNVYMLNKQLRDINPTVSNHGLIIISKKKCDTWNNCYICNILFLSL
jgi:hypothetical protein